MPTQWCFPLAVLPFLRPNVSLSALNKHFSHSGRPQIAVQAGHSFICKVADVQQKSTTSAAGCLFLFLLSCVHKKRKGSHIATSCSRGLFPLLLLNAGTSLTLSSGLFSVSKVTLLLCTEVSAAAEWDASLTACVSGAAVNPSYTQFIQTLAPCRHQICLWQTALV